MPLKTSKDLAMEKAEAAAEEQEETYDEPQQDEARGEEQDGAFGAGVEAEDAGVPITAALLASVQKSIHESADNAPEKIIRDFLLGGFKLFLSWLACQPEKPSRIRLFKSGWEWLNSVTDRWESASDEKPCDLGFYPRVGCGLTDHFVEKLNELGFETTLDWSCNSEGFHEDPYIEIDWTEFLRE